MPNVDVAPLSPVVGLGEGLPVGKHIAPLCVGTLSEAVVVHPGRPVVDIAGVQLSVGWAKMGKRGRKGEATRSLQGFGYVNHSAPREGSVFRWPGWASAAPEASVSIPSWQWLSHTRSPLESSFWQGGYSSLAVKVMTEPLRAGLSLVRRTFGLPAEENTAAVREDSYPIPYLYLKPFPLGLKATRILGGTFENHFKLVQTRLTVRPGWKT